MTTLCRTWIGAAMAVTLIACDDDGTNPDTNPGFAVTLSSQTLSVEQNSETSMTASIVRTGDFDGTVTLLVEGVPAGLTVSIDPPQITNGTTSATLMVEAAPTLAPGTYTFTIRAQAPGLADQTYTATVTVTGQPLIALALTPTSDTLVQGASANYAATLTRSNFTGSVTVEVTGAPAGVTTTVTPNADVYTVAITVADSTAPGTFQLMTTASGTGVDSAVATFELTVTPTPASVSLTAAPDTVTLTTADTAQAVITIARSNFLDSVTLAATGLPAGVTATINETPTTADSATITFTASAGLTPGDYPVTITGSGTGISDTTTSIVVHIPVPPSITISASPDSLSLDVAGTVSSSIAIARTNFTDSVSFAVSGAPTGVTATFSPSSTVGDSVQLNIASGSVVALPGTYSLTVTASGAGVSDTTIVRLIVPLPAGITLSAQPPSLSIVQGDSATITLAITRLAFTGTVNFSATAPTGITVTFSPDSTLSDSTTVTLRASGSATVATDTVVITAAGIGIANTTLQLPITVTAAAAGRVHTAPKRARSVDQTALTTRR